MNKAWLVGWVLFAVGCGPDMGACVEPNVVGLRDPRYVDLGDVNGDGRRTRDEFLWPGQGIIDSSCAAGRCHSAVATGVQRQGAPKGLDFDAPTQIQFASNLPLWRAGIVNIRENVDAMWDEIDSGLMPPNDLIPDTEAARNWLACGAPTQAPNVVPPTGANFDSVYGTLMGCLGCHSDSAAPALNSGMALGMDMCTAYNRLVNQPSSAVGMCAGRTYVVPQDPAASLLVQKLTNNPGCGAIMPSGSAMSFEVQSPAVFTQIQQWIANGAQKPASCP